MSSYYSPTKGVVNRYWKRPKPRVYECNIRDAERFYQQSYKDYLEAKENAARKASADRLKSGDDYLSQIGYKRSNSMFDSIPDYSTRNAMSFDLEDKDFSFKSSLMKSNDDDLVGTSFRISSLKDGNEKYSETSDTKMIDDRLQRIQKLRSEMGLPSEAHGLSSRVRFQTPSLSTDTKHYFNGKNNENSHEPRSRRGKTVGVSENYSFKAQTNGFYRPSEVKSDRYESKISSEKEIFSKFNGVPMTNGDHYSTKENKSKMNGREPSYTDDLEKYSVKNFYKNSKKISYDDNIDEPVKTSDFKKSTESKFTKSSFKNAETSSFNDIDGCDDDALLTNIKKKFPTSDEILERIKKMNSEI